MDKESETEIVRQRKNQRDTDRVLEKEGDIVDRKRERERQTEWVS